MVSEGKLPLLSSWVLVGVWLGLAGISRKRDGKFARVRVSINQADAFGCGTVLELLERRELLELLWSREWKIAENKFVSIPQAG
jgi:hypothetical protein